MTNYENDEFWNNLDSIIQRHNEHILSDQQQNCLLAKNKKLTKLIPKQ